MSNETEAPRPEANEDTNELETTDLPEVVLTVDEVARLLRINRKSVYESIRRREFPGVRRIGGTIRISRKTVLAWVDEGQPCVSRSTRSPR